MLRIRSDNDNPHPLRVREDAEVHNEEDSDEGNELQDYAYEEDEEQDMPQPDEDIMDIDIEEAPEPEGIDDAENEMVDLYPFNSFTEASLSLFFETSGISESNFSSLLEILSHDSFKKEDVPPNVSVFKIRKNLPKVPISVHGDDSHFYHFNMEKTVDNILKNNMHMAKMTFVPVTDCHRDAFNSRLFHQSKLFCIQSVKTNVGKVTALDIIRINTDRRAQLARVESIAFDSSKETWSLGAGCCSVAWR
ncbi:uncharacterized protein LOC125891665 isoform X2 [Epinephelus fuscoguttatus]|uniref:uncharacterized protein LOC125891665 isoform X2 n=1 Tax=Epinephelus fuscoguttatus TaxID=293821 RepID=UPI0020D097F3|nr:uncharacterized protein LOC125891665 isoform X2 [Epinephelus fuscoguttatus]